MTEKQKTLLDNNLASTILYSMVKLGMHSTVEELSDFDIDRINDYITANIPDKETIEDVAVHMETVLGQWEKIKKKAL
jgi:hypothetical protein